MNIRLLVSMSLSLYSKQSAKSCLQLVLLMCMLKVRHCLDWHCHSAGVLLSFMQTELQSHVHVQGSRNAAASYQPAVQMMKPTKRKSSATAEATFRSVCHRPLLNLQ